MTYKTARNAALRNIDRLIRAEYHGELWSAPGGYFAINLDIYSDYKPKKYQDTRPNGGLESLPQLDKILDNDLEYALAEFEKTDENSYVTLSSTATNNTYKVQKLFFDCIRAYYPNFLPYIATNGQYHSPVKIFNNGELVATISPIRSK